jgi:putative N6-adenine-specific DNA methylase
LKLKPETYDMLAKTMAGMEDLLAEELKDLGAADIAILPRAVSFKGDKVLMYKANLWCRTALRILKPIAVFLADDENKLYNQINSIEWEKYLGINDTLAIDTVIGKEVGSKMYEVGSKNNNPFFTNSLYLSQKAKDAIVDRFYKINNQRPSVDLDNPSLRINLHINKDKCTVSLDSSGISLHKRGYRQKTGLAPINEVLAAGMILLSGWERDCSFIDPMCGSGTFLIEAAMIAKNIPAGHFRKEYGFQKWNDFDSGLWNEILADSLKQKIKFNYEIIGSDISETLIKTAEENIKFAGFHKDILLHCSSFEEFDPQRLIASGLLTTNNEQRITNNGIIIMNPPYGERLREEDIVGLYKSIGDTLKQKCAGFTAWIISSDLDAIKFIGLKPSRKIKIYNGPLECRFLKFDIYEGSRKTMSNEQ